MHLRNSANRSLTTLVPLLLLLFRLVLPLFGGALRGHFAREFASICCLFWLFLPLLGRALQGHFARGLVNEVFLAGHQLPAVKRGCAVEGKS